MSKVLTTGILNNNRFLQRVNPEIRRASADASNLVSVPSDVMPLMRQMVDLGIVGNLKLWVHSGLVDTRVSGSDLFIPKGYDISGEENDAAQTTEAGQPKLVSDGMEFDGDNDRLGLLKNPINGLTAFSHSGWFNVSGDMGLLQYWLTDDLQMQIRGRNENLQFYLMTTSYAGGIMDTYSYNEWTHVVGVYNGSQMLMYKNGDLSSTTFNQTGAVRTSNNDTMRLGGSAGSSEYWNSGPLNDIRTFNTALSAAQITAIFNATKSDYGL